MKEWKPTSKTECIKETKKTQGMHSKKMRVNKIESHVIADNGVPVIMVHKKVCRKLVKAF